MVDGENQKKQGTGFGRTGEVKRCRMEYYCGLGVSVETETTHEQPVCDRIIASTVFPEYEQEDDCASVFSRYDC